jgi:hypothetical protein
MNYKVLAASVVISAGVIALGLYEAQSPPERSVERLSTLDIAAPPTASFAVAEPMSPSYRSPPAPVAAEDAASEAAIGEIADIGVMPAIPVGMPQIAYVYAFGYRIAGPKIPALQQRHTDLCESKGPQVCRIMAMSQSGDEGTYAHGSLQLAVASGQARAFGRELGSLAESAEGEQVSATISGEDMSKQIVDTEARLRARTVLRDRLMDVLATRRGTVAELVEAERGVARVNEEIDQARSWLREMEGRVTYSRIDLTYTAGAPAKGGFLEPVRGAIGSLGAIFGLILAGLIVIGSVALPVLAAILGALWLRRRYGWGEAPAPAA